MPGYEIKCWDNKSLESIDNAFVRNAIADRRWAFVADYVRLHALYKQGGVYFDTDVKLYTDIRDLLICDVMIPIQTSVATGYNLMSAVIAATPGHPYIKACLDYYSNLEYDSHNYRNVVINPIMSKILHDKWEFMYEDKYQELPDGIKILDRTFFRSDFDLDNINPKKFYGVHYCNQSWVPSNRGWLYNFCKSNDFMPIYKIISSSINFIKR